LSQLFPLDMGAWVFSATVRSTRIFKEASTEAGYEWLSVAKQLPMAF